MTRKQSGAAAAKRYAMRYLAPVMEGGRQLGWRFNPGPALRKAGAKSQRLRRTDGSWLTFEEAKAYRDAAVTGAPIATTAAANPTPQVKRTLNALWSLYLESPAFTAKHGVHDDALADDTRRFYKSMIKHWLNLAGDLLVAALDEELIRESYQAMKGITSHSTAHASLRALQSVLAFGVTKKWIAANPALKLGLSRPQGRLRLGTPDEMTALVQAADELKLQGIGDAIVAALWTAQRQADLLACDLGRQFDGEFLMFARTHTDDTSQEKTGAQVLVPVLSPLLDRLGDRRFGPLAPFDPERVHAGRRGPVKQNIFWNAHTFRHEFATVRALAAQAVPSVIDFEYRDTRDTAVTRLHDAGKDPLEIAHWSGHSHKSVGDILQKHYVVTHKDKQRESGEQFEAWRIAKGIKY